jgi:hypothetical protein
VKSSQFEFKKQRGEKRVDALADPLASLLFGEPIQLSYSRSPRAVRGKLISGGTVGRELDGASFIRQRRIVLANDLSTAENQRVLLHELFHFAWVRLSNRQRRSYELLLRAEIARGVQGELSWPSFQAKGQLRPQDLDSRSKTWRGYACESFCDTCSWYWRGMPVDVEGAFPKSEKNLRQSWVASWAQSDIRV